MAGVAALLGGASWTIKAIAILSGGAQPALLFEVAPLAMGLALLGLAALPKVGPFARLSALFAGGLAVAAFATYLVMPAHWMFNLLFLAANLSVVVALWLVGGHVRRRDLLGARSRLPRRIALWTVPAMIAGGLIAEIDDRLLELPILLLGLAWCLLGIVCLGRRNQPPEATPPAGGKPDPQVTRPPARSTSGARPRPRP